MFFVPLADGNPMKKLTLLLPGDTRRKVSLLSAPKIPVGRAVRSFPSGSLSVFKVYYFRAEKSGNDEQAKNKKTPQP